MDYTFVVVSKKSSSALASVAPLVGVSSHKPEGGGSDPQSGHMPRLQVRLPLGVGT